MPTLKGSTWYGRSVLDRLMSYVVPVTESGCWLWTGAQSMGYGQLLFHRKLCGAHRVMWQLTYGPIPKGLHVLHKCDVPACVRPEHLHLGTSADNLRECAERGRSARGGKKKNARLTEDIVRQIRSSTRSNIELALEFHVDPSTVSYARNGKNWAWL